MRTSHHTGVSTFASRTSPSTDQSLQKSFHLSHADKIELKKISFPSENKKYLTAQPDTTKIVKLATFAKPENVVCNLGRPYMNDRNQ